MCGGDSQSVREERYWADGQVELVDVMLAEKTDAQTRVTLLLALNRVDLTNQELCKCSSEREMISASAQQRI